jgi:hypothetical protein
LLHSSDGTCHKCHFCLQTSLSEYFKSSLLNGKTCFSNLFYINCSLNPIFSAIVCDPESKIPYRHMTYIWNPECQAISDGFEISEILRNQYNTNRRMLFPRMLRHVALVRTNVSEERSTSIIRVTRIAEPGTTWLTQYLFTVSVGC